MEGVQEIQSDAKGVLGRKKFGNHGNRAKEPNIPSPSFGRLQTQKSFLTQPAGPKSSFYLLERKEPQCSGEKIKRQAKAAVVLL